MKNILKHGDKAPAFKVNDVHGVPISLPNSSSKSVLLVFLRYAGCPWCNLAIHRLTLEYSRLQKNNCDVIAFIQSSPDKIIKNIFHRHKIPPPFPVVADQKKVIYKLYGVAPSIKATFASIDKIPQWVHSVKDLGFKQRELDGNFFMVPAWFLVDGKTKKIIKCNYSSSFYDHNMFVSIYETLIFPD